MCRLRDSYFCTIIAYYTVYDIRAKRLYIHITYTYYIAPSPTFLDMKKHPELESLSHICNDYSSNRMYTLHGVGALYHIMRAVEGDVCYICFSVTAILSLTRMKTYNAIPSTCWEACTHRGKWFFQDAHPTVLRFTQGLYACVQMRPPYGIYRARTIYCYCRACRHTNAPVEGLRVLYEYYIVVRYRMP